MTESGRVRGRDVLVVGASGLDGLRSFVAAVPADPPAADLVALISPGPSAGSTRTAALA